MLLMFARKGRDAVSPLASLGSWVITLLLSSACSCSEPALVDRTPAFTLEPDSMDFPLVPVGGTHAERVVLHNRTEASIELKLRAPPPFSLAEPSVRLGPSQSRMLEVYFSPSAAGPVERRLEAIGKRYRAEALVRGIGAEACGPDSSCATYTLDEASGACVESPRPDGATCEMGACLVDGRCQSGRCVGRMRDCDDDNPCTRDLCDPAQGCLSVEDLGACPIPGDPCLVATCDPDAGCGTRPLPDGEACGERSCTALSICLAGSCRQAPAPPEQRIEPVWAHPGRLQGSDGEGNLVLSLSESGFIQDGPIISVASDGSLRWTIEGEGERQYVEAVTEGRLVTRIQTDTDEASTTAVYSALDGSLLWRRLVGDSWAGGWGGRLLFEDLIYDEGSEEDPDVRNWTKLEVVDAASGTSEAWVDLPHVRGLSGIFDEFGHWYATSVGREPFLLDVDTGQEVRLPFELEPPLASGAVFDGILVGTFRDVQSQQLRIYIANSAGTLALGPRVQGGGFGRMVTDPAKWIGGSGGPAVLIDDSSVWMVASAPTCFPSGPNDPCVIESHAYRFAHSGELRWVEPLGGNLMMPPILTDRGTGLLVFDPEFLPGAFREPGGNGVLVELDGAGRTVLRCPLGFPVRGSGVLLDELLVVSEFDPATRSTTVRAIRLPGYRASTRGWVSDVGSFSRPFAARSGAH